MADLMQTLASSANHTDVAVASLAVITVSFHPDMAVLARQMHALPSLARWVVVDNASFPHEVAALTELVASRENSELLLLDSNRGLPSALNAGVSRAAQVDPGIQFILLMDQDSEPQPLAIERLLERYLQLEAQGLAVGCVGPTLLDDSSNLQHGFHCMQGLRWVRRFPVRDAEPVSCANMNGSGTLVRLSLYQQLGGLNEAFFIDHVDTDWSFRVLAAGYGLFGIPDSVFIHRMGESSFRFWLFGWKIWPQRSPLRHRYLFRNAIFLLRKPYVPGVWKFWAVIKLLLTFAVHGVFDRQRFKQMGSMLKGLKDGFSKSAC